MKNLIKLLLLITLLIITHNIHAAENIVEKRKGNNSFLETCVRPLARYDMKVNNVRARLLTGGDLFAEAQYITPASAEIPVTGIYAAGVWMGGVDRAKNIKLSAVTYRSLGFDYFAGPLDINGTSEKVICNQWDKIFSVKGKNIAQHINNYKEAQSQNQSLTCDDIPEDVLLWPAQGNPYFEDEFGWSLPDQPLAGFWDMNNDGNYDPCNGDYPMVVNQSCIAGYHEGFLVPAEINYFIFNDNSGPQTLSGPRSMQMEFQVNAYAYNTTDELNDMTFYQYTLINKASEDLIDCYFGLWVDPDLGCYQDDYIGCDPDLGMAYIYNQDAIDGINGTACGGTNTYKSKIPILGFNFVKGPLVSKVYKRDANGNIVYEPLLNFNGDTVKYNNEIILQQVLMDPPQFSGNQDTLVEGKMSSFTYSEGDFGNPSIPIQAPQYGREDGFYNYMRGLWADGSPIVAAGTGYNSGSTDTTKFIFHDDPSDSNGWSMCTANLPLGDRRMLMSVGPMLMQPGATNSLIVSVFSVYDVQYPCPDLTKLKYVKGVAQTLLDGCYDGDMFDSPDAPNMIGKERDNEIVLILENLKSSNNYDEKFQEIIPNLPSIYDPYYKFEGYKIYQVANPFVRIDQLNDPHFAKLVAQTDIKNAISDIYNWHYILNPNSSNGINTYIWIPELKVNGKNQGLETVFSITEDLFEPNDKSLINGKEYHFAAVAYAHNNWKYFDNIEIYGQKTPYLEGRSNYKVYTFSPKQILVEDEPRFKVTRISGEGNPHTFLLMEDNMYDKVLNNNFDGKIQYKTGYGPLHGKVFDQNKLLNHKYRLEIIGNFLFSSNGNGCKYDEEAIWRLTDITTNEILLDEKSLWYIKEYTLNELGFTFIVRSYEEPASLVYSHNGSIGAIIEYNNRSEPFWLHAIKNEGKYFNKKSKVVDFVGNSIDDPNTQLSGMGDGFFIPFLSTKFENNPTLPFYLSPAARDIMAYVTSPNINSLRYRDLNNVDIIFTKDKTKWSKCIVVESASADYYELGTIGNTKNFDLRESPSIDQDGKEIVGSKGFSYFPGYAVDVETGKRLNIFFGENSIFSGVTAQSLKDKNPIGGDMIFNPGSEDFVSHNGEKLAVFGGQHYIYVTRMEYDECKEFGDRLKRLASGVGPSLLNKAKVISAITWTSFPMLSESMPLTSLEKGLIPNDAIIRMRVDNPYGSTRRYTTAKERACETDGDNPVYEFGFDNFQILSAENNTLHKVFVSPNPASTQSGSIPLQLYNLPDDVTIEMIDMTGQVVQRFVSAEGNKSFLTGPGVSVTSFDFFKNNKTSLFLIKITNNQNGQVKTIKWMVI